MNSPYQNTLTGLVSRPHTWLVTGVAGFIGSHLLEELLKLKQKVVGLDNFFSGHKKNLAAVQAIVTDLEWKNFKFIEGDIRDSKACDTACRGVDYILHHAALGSVPRSIEDPVLANAINVDGTLNILSSAHQTVLLNEAIDALAIRSEGVYVDGTFGRGGHTEMLMKHFPLAKVVSFDKDEAAIDFGRKKFSSSITVSSGYSVWRIRLSIPVNTALSTIAKSQTFVPYAQ